MTARPTSVRRRVVLATAAWTAAAILVLLVALQVVLELVVARNIDHALAVRLDAATTRVQRAASPSAAELDDLGGEVALVDAEGTVLDGSLPVALRRTAGRLAAEREDGRAEVAETYQVAYRALPDGLGLVAVEPVGPYELAGRVLLVLSLVLGPAAVLGVGLVAAWSVGRSLRPVAAMARSAEDWSEHDLERRFTAGPAPAGGSGDELVELAATFDRLLDRVAEALAAERRLTSEVAHELRTPLTAVLGNADLVLLRGDLGPESRELVAEIAAGARRMREVITTLVSLSRDATEGRACAEDALSLLDLHGVRLDLDADLAQRVVAAPSALVARAVAPVLDNARRLATGEVSLRLEPRGQRALAFVVTDEGPGLPADPETVFTAGGLGLPLARRVARAGRGDVVATAVPGGVRVDVWFPLA